jgi:hypothetical protein
MSTCQGGKHATIYRFHHGLGEKNCSKTHFETFSKIYDRMALLLRQILRHRQSRCPSQAFRFHHM